MYHLDFFAHGGAHGTVGVEDLALLGQTPAHGTPPLFFGPQTRFDEGGGVRAGFRVVWVADHAVAGPPTEELVDGDPESLPLDILQRYVHGRDRRRTCVGHLSEGGGNTIYGATGTTSSTE
jgi:hypothetical protein